MYSHCNCTRTGFSNSLTRWHTSLRPSIQTVADVGKVADTDYHIACKLAVWWISMHWSILTLLVIRQSYSSRLALYVAISTLFLSLFSENVNPTTGGNTHSGRIWKTGQQHSQNTAILLAPPSSVRRSNMCNTPPVKIIRHSYVRLRGGR